MGMDECHYKARYFLGLARRMSRPEDRAVFAEMAAVWMDRAKRAEPTHSDIEERERS